MLQKQSNHSSNTNPKNTSPECVSSEGAEQASFTYSCFDPALDIFVIQPIFFGESAYGIDQSIYFSPLSGYSSRTLKG